MRRILLFLCLIASSALFAQLPRNLLTSTTRVSLYDDYDGSIYMKSRYKESSVIDEKSGTFDAKLKYNIYSDALEYSSQSKLYEVVKSPTIHARIDGDYFYYCEFKNQRGSNRDGYYVLVELTDRYRIYKKFTLKIKDPEKKGPIISGPSEPGTLRMITSYYLEESGVIMELPMNKKEMLAAFNDKENELKDYLKKERIRLRKEEDLIRLVARYNALKSSDSSPSRSLLSNTDRGN
ncbi:hypothetical protein ATO12_11590 [Aquimarina atlantica]|uniref:DUF4468 domain-containing protein n=1 Tax=Aquimarina atlantica TaxID=1317122 RepID=A0A023BWM1_9FLAO|nr:hypothetical protein [Aquimarina atlantica]EZH74405.1 hypothetical protein ATO12_11590 [Aquimarina atlantica]